MIASLKNLRALGNQDEKPAWWRWAIVVTASLGALLEVIDTSIVNVALPHMQGNLGATLSEIGWVITGYAMANVIMIPLSAWLGDRFGKKNYFIFCLIGFTLASVLCGLASSLPMLIISRILQGLAGGGLLAKGQAIIFETFPKEEQPLAQAVFGLGVIVGPAIGPTLGGYLTDILGWRSIFFINIPFGILATLAATIFFKKDHLNPDRNLTVDWLGILFLAVGLAALQIMLEEGHQEDWFSSGYIVTMAVVSIIALTLFVWQELTIEHPAVDLSVLRYRSLAAGSVFSVILGIGLYGTMFAVPIFAQSLLNFTAAKTGELLIPGALTSAVFMILGSQLSKKIDARLLILTGAVMTAIPMFTLAQLNPNTGVDQLFWPLIIRGAGTVLMFMPLTLASLGPIPPKDISAASGFFNLTRQIGGSVGIAMLTTILSQRENHHRSILVEHVSLYDAHVRQQLAGIAANFEAHGSSAGMAMQQAHELMNRMINQQSAILSFADMFWIVGCLFITSLLLLSFLGSGQHTSDKALSDVH